MGKNLVGPSIPRHLRLIWPIGGLAILLLGVGWAAGTVLASPDKVLDSSSFTYVEVVAGEVGSSINLNSVAEWTSLPVGSNLAVGIVTTLNVSPGQEVDAGAILYSVNLRPVVVAEGVIPAFESMSNGSAGADVAQLQTMLTKLGFYGYEVDGKFGWTTQAAVEEWQGSLGLEPDGVVQPGDIVFVPNIPTRVALDNKVKRGASLVGGEIVVQGLPTSPTFTIPATVAQAGLMPAGTRVEITGPAGENWTGFVVDQVKNTTDDNVTLELGSGDSGPICADACSTVPVEGEALLRSRVVTVETVAGLVVPSSALLSKADGSLALIDKAGAQHAVKVVTGARGMSIVEGVSAGTMVRIPAMVGD